MENSERVAIVACSHGCVKRVRTNRSATCVVLTCCLFGGGCNPGPPASNPGSGVQNATKATSNQCDILVRSLLDTFDLKKLGVISDLETGVAYLNQWRETCARPPAGEPSRAVFWTEARKTWLTADALASIEHPQFTLRDGEHFRDCLLCKAVNKYAVGQATTDLQRVSNLFEHVIHAVDLIAAHPEDLPLTLYDVYMTGKGTAEDRAWLFVSLLRQLKIDAVVLSRGAAETSAAGSAAQGQKTPWLVGVLLDGEVYLFDPALGLAVPAVKGSGTAATSGVATLAQVVADPAILKQFDIDAHHPYGIRGEDLQNPAVSLVGNTSLWSLRMESLQGQLTGEHFVVVFDSLGDLPAGSGLWTRIAELGSAAKRWDRKSLTVWKYPEAQMAAYATMSAAQKNKFKELTATWAAPQVPTAKEIGTGDKKTRIYVLASENEQFKARLDQVNGEFQEAVVGYTHVRLWRNSMPPGADVGLGALALNSRAADDASYWLGLCLFEQGEFAIAAQTFEKYLKANVEGAWIDAARYHLALCQAALGHFADAATTLQEVSSESPQYAGHQLLIRRWKRMKDRAATSEGK